MAQRDDGGGLFILLLLGFAWGWFSGLFKPKKKEPSKPEDEKLTPENTPLEMEEVEEAPEVVELKEEIAEEEAVEEDRNLKEEVAGEKEELPEKVDGKQKLLRENTEEIPAEDIPTKTVNKTKEKINLETIPTSQIKENKPLETHEIKPEISIKTSKTTKGIIKKEIKIAPLSSTFKINPLKVPNRDIDLKTLIRTDEVNSIPNTKDKNLTVEDTSATEELLETGLAAELSAYPTLISIITDLSSSVTRGEDDDNTKRDKITILADYAIDALEEIEKYNMSDEYIEEGIYLNSFEVVSEDFLKEAYESNDFYKAFGQAIQDARGAIQQDTVEVTTLGDTGITMQEYQTAADEAVEKALENGEIDNSKDELKLREELAEEMGVRQHVALGTFSRENFRISSPNHSMEELYNFLFPLAITSKLSRNREDEDRGVVTLFPPTIDGNVKDKFDLGDKLFAIIFLETKGEFAEDFFIDSDGAKTLNIKNEEFTFNIDDYSSYNIDYSKYLNKAELKEIEKNSDFSVSFKNILTYERYEEWKSDNGDLIESVKSVDLNIRITDASIQEKTVASKFSEGSYLPTDEYGRNFDAVNDRYTQTDKKTENIKAYKNAYALSLLRSINKEMSEEEGLDYQEEIQKLQNLSQGVKKINKSGLSSQQKQGRDVILNYLDHQITLYKLKSDIKGLTPNI